MTAVHGQAVYDFQALGAMKNGATSEDAGALREAARQFESLFTHMLFKSMRGASLGEGAFDSSQGEFYRDLSDQQMSLELSRGRGLGIADLLVRQFGGGQDRPQPGPLATPVRTHAVSVQGVEPKQDFVQSMLPHARKAARSLGVAPHLLLAQAALETGWGQRVITGSDGKDSHNVFGVKAGGSWSGPKARVSTVEFTDGVAERKTQDFRAYRSLAHSFDDYARLIKDNPRYREALNQGDDASGFARALQSGGYATDPDYASKIEAIASSTSLSSALGSMKHFRAATSAQ